jgi:hypothetical protein
MKNFFRWLFGLPIIDRPHSTPRHPIQNKPIEKMDQGDYHSGPHGYSPNTACPETQYGSGFDEDAEWNEEH